MGLHDTELKLSTERFDRKQSRRFETKSIIGPSTIKWIRCWTMRVKKKNGDIEISSTNCLVSVRHSQQKEKNSHVNNLHAPFDKCKITWFPLISIGTPTSVWEWRMILLKPHLNPQNLSNENCHRFNWWDFHMHEKTLAYAILCHPLLFHSFLIT